MKRLDGYILRELAGPFLFGVAAFTSIMVGSNLLFRMAQYLTEWNMPFALAGKLFLMELPAVIVLTFPMATLLATLLAFGRMSGSSEIIAFRAGGVSFERMVIPVLIVGILISGITVYVNERVVPFTTYESRRLITEFRTKKPLPSTQKYLTFTPIDQKTGMPDYILYAKGFNGETKTLSQVYYQEFTGKDLVYIVEAEQAKWLDEQWIFYNGKSYYFPDQDEPVVKAEFTQYEMKTIQETPRQISLGSKKTEEMTATELKDLIDTYKDNGRDVNKLLVTFHQRYAVPLACLIFALIGAPLGLQPNRSGSSIGLGLSVLVIFVYYVVMMVGGSLGQAGVISPVMGAWLPNLLFGLIGIGFNYKASHL